MASGPIEQILDGIEGLELGFGLFDDELRLIVCNSQFAKLRDYPDELCRSGVEFEALLRHNAERGDYDADVVEAHLAEVKSGGARTIEQVMPDGTVLAVRTASLSDGGLLLTYQDISELRAAERTARESERRHAMVTEATTEGLYDWNVEEDKLFVSPQLNRMFGFEEGMLQAENWVAGVHPDDRIIYADATRSHLKGACERLSVEYRVRTLDGEYRWIHDSAVAERNNDGRAIRLVGALSDITEQKQAAEALRQSEELHVLALEAVGEWVYDWNAVTNETYYSDGMYDSLGLTKEQLQTADDWVNRIHPDDRNDYLENFSKLSRREVDTFSAEFRFLGADGGWRWASQHGAAVRDEKGELLRVTGSSGDISERRKMSEELERAQTHLAEALESISQGFALFDTEDRLVMCNTPYRQFFAGTAHPDVAALLVPGMKFEDFVRAAYEKGMYPDAGDDIDAYMATRMARRRNPSGDFELRLRDGTWLYVTEQRTSEGGLVALYTDITEAKRREAELQAARDRAENALAELHAAQDRLIESERLASLGQVTAGVAHEIKNPLNFVNNFAKLSGGLLDELTDLINPLVKQLEEEDREDAEDIVATLRDNMEKIEHHGKRADGIVQSMLAHSREGSGERQEIEINMLADEALNLAYHGARAENQSFNVTLLRDLDDNAGNITGQQQDLMRVFLNLAGNAIHATDKQRIEGASADYEPTITLKTKDLGDRVEIRLRDNGTGMPDDIKDKIFQPFFTTKPPGEGTGLGLSISYDIIAQGHNGRFDVESREGEFTEFCVTLPRSESVNVNK